MANDKLEPGDVVQLNSGGPNMTVERYVQEGDKATVLCVWFPTPNSDKTKEAVLHVSMLTKID